MKTIFSLLFISGLILVLSSACGGFNPCGGGQQECSDGTCAPAGNTCCGNGTSCPPSAPICGAGNTCLSSQPQGCLGQGEESCYNNDGTVDCAPLGAACCGNHHWCPVGTVCNAAGTGCVQ